MKISARDPSWESLVSAAFKDRIAFDLKDLDKAKLSEAEIHKLIVAWSVRWIYSPTFTGDNSIRFIPDKLPPLQALWNIPPPDQRYGKRL